MLTVPMPGPMGWAELLCEQPASPGLPGRDPLVGLDEAAIEFYAGLFFRLPANVRSRLTFEEFLRIAVPLGRRLWLWSWWPKEES